MNGDTQIKEYKRYLTELVSFYIERSSKYGLTYYYEFLDDIEDANTEEELEMLCQITDSWLDY